MSNTISNMLVIVSGNFTLLGEAKKITVEYDFNGVMLSEACRKAAEGYLVDLQNNLRINPGDKDTLVAKKRERQKALLAEHDVLGKLKREVIKIGSRSGAEVSPEVAVQMLVTEKPETPEQAAEQTRRLEALMATIASKLNKNQ